MTKKYIADNLEVVNEINEFSIDGTLGDNSDSAIPTEKAVKTYVDSVSSTATFLGLTDTPGSYTAGSVLFTSGSAVTEDNSNLFWDNASKELGIGTNTPSQQLDITGNFELTNTTNVNQNGIIYKGTSPFIHDFNYGGITLGRNVFIGENAGNFTMGSGAGAPTDASNNIGIGYNAFNSNTLGNFSVAVGVEALSSNTTGTYNVAFGGSSLRQNISGTNNAAFGHNSLLNNTSGNYNVALGRDALSGNTTGTYNVAFGYNAGSSTASGSNQTSTNSVYVGRDTKASADGNTNEVVIGYNVTGNGSNTVTIGNSSITNTYLQLDESSEDKNVKYNSTTKEITYEATPSFHVHRNGTDQTVTTDTLTKIDWTTEDFDTNSDFDLSNDRFLPTVPGKYLIIFNGRCQGNTGICQIRIRKNGSDVSLTASPSGENFVNTSLVVDMNGSTDYVEAWATNYGGTVIEGTATQTYFSGSKVAD